MSQHYTTDGHGLMRDGKRYAVCDTPAAAEDLARICNCHEALVEACQAARRQPHSAITYEKLNIALALAHTAQGDV